MRDLKTWLMCFVVASGSVGCTSIKTNLLHRDECNTDWQYTQLKGMPITLEVPTHVRISVFQKSYFYRAANPSDLQDAQNAYNEARSAIDTKETEIHTALAEKGVRGSALSAAKDRLRDGETAYYQALKNWRHAQLCDSKCAPAPKPAAALPQGGGAIGGTTASGDGGGNAGQQPANKPEVPVIDPCHCFGSTEEFAGTTKALIDARTERDNAAVVLQAAQATHDQSVQTLIRLAGELKGLIKNGDAAAADFQAAAAASKTLKPVDVGTRVDYVPIKTKKIFTVDPKRPAAGTVDWKLALNDQQYFTRAESEISDLTIQEIGLAIERISGSGGIAKLFAPRPPKPATTGKSASEGGMIDQSEEAKYIEIESVVASRVFEFDDPEFEDRVSAFLDQYANRCGMSETETVIQQPSALDPAMLQSYPGQLEPNTPNPAP